MTEFVELIKKYGALGVVCVWLFMTTQRVNKLEEQLYDCLRMSSNFEKSTNKTPRKNMYFAILPKEIKTEKE
jgi:hypothetical protein